MGKELLPRACLLFGFLASWMAGAAEAFPRFNTAEMFPFQPRGADVGMPLLIEFYEKLPSSADDRETSAAYLKALNTFKRKVAERYSEGTLQRLLGSPHLSTRRAAALALGMLGTMRSNKDLAELLHDEDGEVRQQAASALWSVWFRGDTEANNQDLQRLLRLGDPQKALAGLNGLLDRAPTFAEAYNQRAILLFRMEEYHKSIADCENALKLNPFHFGAQSGMAQGYMKLAKPRSALKAFRNAYRINPALEGVEETIRALEEALGEEGKNK